MKLSTNGKVIFRDPTPQRRGAKPHGKQSVGDILDNALRSNPNKWALYDEKVGKATAFSKRFLGSEYERAYRQVNTKKGVKKSLFIRYIGTSETAVK